MGRETEYALTSELEGNLAVLLERLNRFREIYGKPMVVSSGYRPGRYNELAGGAPNSAHRTCEACDFRDVDGSLKGYIAAHPEILDTSDLYMEAPERTPTWVHLDTRKRKSRIFQP